MVNIRSDDKKSANSKLALHKFLKSGVGYLIIDGIVDFFPSGSDPVEKSYEDSSGFYDSYITSSNPFTLLYNKVVWGMKDDDYVGKVLSFIPGDFHGVILDVPVGTGVLTADRYARLKNSTIIACDYTPAMLYGARKRFTDKGVENAFFIHGDVANLGLRDQSVDLVLSMNGFHAFPLKQAVIREISRVLKPGGLFAGCFYVKGKRRFTDGVVRIFYSRTGWFSPPFFTEDDVLSKFGRYFVFERTGNCQSIFWFKVRKPNKR